MPKLISIPITTEYIQLNSLLKLCGIAYTGGEANSLIAEGLISVDGEPEFRLRRKIRPGMTVLLPEGETVQVYYPEEEK